MSCRDEGDIRDFDLRPLVVSIRSKLQKLSHLPVPSEAFVTALLGAAAGDDDCLAYLRGQPLNVSVGGVRLAQLAEDHVARSHIDALVSVVGATGGALFLAFDQLEQSRVQGWEQRLRHLFSRRRASCGNASAALRRLRGFARALRYDFRRDRWIDPRSHRTFRRASCAVASTGAASGRSAPQAQACRAVRALRGQGRSLRIRSIPFRRGC